MEHLVYNGWMKKCTISIDNKVIIEKETTFLFDKISTKWRITIFTLAFDRTLWSKNTSFDFLTLLTKVFFGQKPF